MSLSLAVLILVFLAIALRQLFRIPLKIWQIMSLGALLVLLTGQIAPKAAWAAIDWNVLIFLFGMFAIGQALEESGLLSEWATRFLGKQCSPQRLAASIVFAIGLLSALLMNDTLAILGTPLLIKAAHQRGIQARPLLLCLAFAITTGSVLSPIGNPQNLLIALQAPLGNPFLTFLSYLALPTLLCLGLLYALTLYTLRRAAPHTKIIDKAEPINRPLARLCKISLLAALLLIACQLVALPWIALAPALFLLLFAKTRLSILKKLDWGTLLFFVALFILMQSVWNDSPLQSALAQVPTSTAGILSLSLLGSQIISNVPLVALYLPVLHTLESPAAYMALAAGSTIAGNFLVFGAASNFIILQNAEKRGEKGISFFEFAKVGTPLTLAQMLIFWIFL